LLIVNQGLDWPPDRKNCSPEIHSRIGLDGYHYYRAGIFTGNDAYLVRKTQERPEANIFHHCANRTERTMIGNATERFDAQGNLTEAKAKPYIRKLLEALVPWTARTHQTQTT
jgi:hypothetical protein